ncbi:aldehyde dehydrogenase family protein, partial [Thalassolituus sp.]
MTKTYPYYLAGEAVYANTDLKVTDKFSGEVAYEVPLATPDVLDEAIAAAEGAAEAMRNMTVYERQAVLEHCVARIRERADELAEALCIEAGKPINDAKGEVGRLIDTFKIAAEETPRILGETLPLDISPRAKGYRGMTQRVPIGPCAFISPFNFPLNLAAHKVAPAIAAGCPFVLKPASMTPIGALVIGEILAETDLPKGAFSILPCRRDSADLLTEDDRLKLLSFTGSPDVGWKLKARAGKKPVVLELGGNAACVVDNDWDLDDAVARVIIGAFYQSGQSCIGVQRLYVHSDVYDTFKEKLLAKTKALKSGDPKDPETFIGPMISESEAERLHGWIKDAQDRGATLLCGGERDGNMLQASLLENVPADCELSAEEAFGPVAILEPFDDYDAVLKRVNDSRFGLQAGIFTRDIYKA